MATRHYQKETDTLSFKFWFLDILVAVNLKDWRFLNKVLRIIFSCFLYRCETWSLTLREGYRYRVFDNRVLRRIFGPKMDEVAGCWEDFIMRSFITCMLHQILPGRSN
jgi:hypothetical protein